MSLAAEEFPDDPLFRPVHKSWPRAIDYASRPTRQPPEALIDGLLYRTAGTIISAEPGKGKTIHALCITAQLVKQGRKVLYLDFGGGLSWTGLYLDAALRGVGLEAAPAGHLLYYSPGDVEADTGLLGVPSNIEGLKDWIFDHVVEHEIDLVVVDSLGQAMLGDMNSAQDVTAALAGALNPARKANAAVLVLDHNTKASSKSKAGSRGPMGSQQKRAWARVVVDLESKHALGETHWRLNKTNAGPWERDRVTRVYIEQNDDKTPRVIRLEGLDGLLGREAGVAPSDARHLPSLSAEVSILEALKAGARRQKDLCEGDRTRERVLKRLVAQGLVVRLERGVYGLPEVRK